MEILHDSVNSMFIAHKAKEKCFWNGEDILEFNYMILDPDTIKTGWGIYNQNGYEFKWDAVLGQKTPQPADGWKRAFSVWVYVDSHDKPLLWERFTYGEFESFKSLLKGFWYGKDENAPKLPCFKYLESEELKVGMGTTAIPRFEFVDWKDRPEKFVLPAHISGDDSAPAEVVKEEKTFDDIPF